jgi:hypothetical protein
MTGERFFKWLFLVAGVYDFVLGALFFLFYVAIYEHFGITLPNHPEYVQAPAAFIVILGIMLFYVFKDMYRNVDMVKIAALSKLAYSGLALYYQQATGLPAVFMVFAWCDLIFLGLFITFLVKVKGRNV